MDYYLDTEFIEDGRTIDLLSIGIVAADGREFYAASTEADPSRANEWVRSHVLPHLPPSGDAAWMNRAAIRQGLLDFVPDEKPTFWGYYCLAPETRVLSADLRWRPIGDVRVDDVLIGFDEESLPGKGRSSRWRRWQGSTVTFAEQVERPCYDLSFDDGSHIRCSEEHGWLVVGQARAKWLTAERLRVGQRVAKPLDTWKTMDSRAGGYLAAAYDGEGHLSQVDRQHLARPLPGKKFRLGFSQKENVMLAEVRRLLLAEGFELHEQRNQGNVITVRIDKRRDVLRLLGSVRPMRLLGKFRPENIGAVPMRPVELIGKRAVGSHQVVSLTTTTRTYVAEGFASHNCDYDWIALCQLFGPMIALPKRFPMFAMDLKQLAVSLGDPRLPKQASGEHNALCDARWNRDTHAFLTAYAAQNRP